MNGGRLIRVPLAFLVLGALLLFVGHMLRVAPAPRYGFTFSSVYADALGINSQSALLSALTDFSPAFVRLPLYWSEIEREGGVFTWETSDALVASIREANADVHMVIGVKVPRWPECFVPAWVDSRDREVFEDELLVYMEAAVLRYADAVDVWQVENEPFFAFGDCPSLDLAFLQEEMALVRRLDPGAQIQVTVSGEQEAWPSVMPFADRVGVSMYRTVRSPFFGFFSFPVPSLWYTLMRIPVSFTHDVVVSELQMEPWFISHPRYIDIETAASYFTVHDAMNNLTYVRATGFDEVSFWGVEWWYYLREQGYPDLWDAMKRALD